MEALPIAGVDTIIHAGDPVILAPHPDDESLGCGGLLAACAAQGRRPRVLILTDGAGSHPNSRSYPPGRLRALREAEALDAVGVLGLGPEQVTFLGLPDTAAPTAGPAFDQVVAAIAAMVGRERPGALLAPWRHDPHCDHAAAHRMAEAVARTTGARHLAYPVWGWTLPGDTALPGPLPSGWRLDIARHLPAKRRAIEAHRSQYSDLIRDDPAGFRLPPSLLARFDQPYETYLLESG